MNKFTCEKCNETFNKGWSDRRAKKEYKKAPWNIPGDEIGVLCDSCFEEFKKWFDNLTEEDHQRIRSD